MTTAALRSARPTQRYPRWFMRMPELLFHLHLDRLVPWVMIVTTGRRTGKPRPVVLDIARRDVHGLWVIAADGLEARWVKNLLASPSCAVTHRGRRFVARASVGAADPGDLAVEVYRDRPLYLKLVYLALGKRVRSEADVRRLSAGAVAVRLQEAR
jgi:deazaflavin-dependent oxidoreductase (nitroreductase family)